MLRIAFFVHGFLPWDVYGVPRHVERLAGYLNNHGHETFVVTVGRRGLPRTERNVDGVSIFRTFYLNLPLKRIQWSWFVYTLASLVEGAALVRKYGIDICHGHTAEWGGLQSLLVSRFTAKPCVITIHGSGLDRYPSFRMPKRLFYLKLADLIICQKRSAIQRLKDWRFKREKYVFLPEGCIDVKVFKQANGIKTSDRPVVTFIGRITAFKGPQLLLQAIPLVLEKHGNAVFQFIGEGDMVEKLIQMARSMRLTGDNIRFLGLRKDVPNLLCASTIAVSVSPFENFTDFALLEAMATGLPVVATDVGETRTLVKDGETGLLARPEPIDIALKICKLLEDRELAERLGKKARELVATAYCLDHFGKQHERLYSRILAQHQRVQRFT